MAKLYLIGILIASVSASAGEVVSLIPKKSTGTVVSDGTPCEVLLFNQEKVVRRARERNIIQSVLDLIRGNMEGREWESEDPQTDYFYNYIAHGLPRLGPSRGDSVIAYSSRTGQFVAVQIVRPYQIFEIVEVVEMMRRFSNPLVAADKIGLEVWFGKSASKVDVLRYASYGKSSRIDLTADDFHRNLLRKGLLAVDEDLGVHSEHVVGRRGSIPSLIWSSVRMAVDPNELSAQRVGRIVDQIRDSVGTHWSLDVGVAP